MNEMMKVVGAVLITSLSSFLFGSFLLKRFHLQQKYHLFALPFGFFFLLALWQLLIYPIQFFHLEARTLLIVYQGLLTLSLIVGAFELKELLKVNWKIVLVVLGLTAVSLLIYSRCNNFYYLVGNQDFGMTGLIDDFTFYVRTIATNAKPDNYVGLVDVMNGTAYNVEAIYAYTGILHFFSALCMFFDANATSFTLWYGFIMLRLIGFLMAFNLAKLIGKDNRILNALVVCVMSLQLFTHTNIINGFEPVYFRGVPGSAAMLILSLVMYYREKEKGWIGVYLLFSIAAMSCQSTQFFLSAILSVCIMTYEAVVKKRFNVSFLTLVSFPVILYLIVFSNVMYKVDWALIMILVLCLVIVNFVYIVVPKLFHYRIVYVLVFLAAALLLSYPYVSVHGNLMLQDSVDYFRHYLLPVRLDNVSIISGPWDVVSEILTRLYLIVPFICLFFFKKLNEDMKLVTVFLCVMIVLFYNPLSMPFVSRFISGGVYGRIENIVINQPFYFIMLSCAASSFSKILLVVLASALTAVPTSLIQFVSYDEQMRQVEHHFDSFYKMDTQIMEISDCIDQLGLTSPTVLYPIELLNLCLYNESIQNSSLMPRYNELKIQDWMYKYDELSERMQMQCYLYLPVDYFTDYYYEFEDDRVPDIIDLLKKTDADVVIFRRWDSEEGENSMFYMYLSLITRKIDEIGEYQIFEILRD